MRKPSIPVIYVILAGRIFLLSFPLHGDVGNWLHLGGLVTSKPGRLTRRGNLLRFLLEILSVLDLRVLRPTTANSQNYSKSQVRPSESKKDSPE